MKENFEEDKEKKEAKAEPAWYEKRADGTAWFETDFDLEGELSRGGDKTGEENAREKALLKEEERYFDFSKEEADGEKSKRLVSCMCGWVPAWMGEGIQWYIEEQISAGMEAVLR